MVVNSSARNYRIRVQIPGGSSLDVSQACTGDSSGYLVLNESEPDEQGICAITGKLVLDVQDRYLDGNDFPQWSDNGQSGRDVFSPDLNPTRWAIGNFIRIEVANDAGTLVSFTRDYLRILKIPAPPYAGNQRLELDIGDDLTLLNWRSPDGDGSEVSRGTATAVGTIVRSILRRATFDNGTNADVDTVTMDGTLNYNTPKSGGSWVDQAGRLAFTAGYILWQNKDQEVIAQPIDLDPGSAFLTATLGEDEIDFKMLQGSEKPASVVKAAGVGQEIEDRIESGSTEVLEYAVRASVPNLDADGAVTNSNDSSPLLIRKTTVDWNWDGDYLIRTDTTNVYEARGVAVSDQFYFDLGMSKPTSPYTPIPSEQIIEKSYYGGYSTPQEGFLIRKERDLYQVSGKALGDYYKGLFQRSGQLPSQTLNMLHVESSDTRYSYVGTQTRKIETKTLSRIGRIAGASTDWANTELTIPNGFDWVVSGTALQEWEEVNPDEWRYTDQEASAGTESGSIAVMLAVVTTRLEINSSTSGQYDPPAAETRPPRYTQTEKELSGTAEFEPTEGEDYAPRERTYQVDHVISDAQCERIAETLGALLYGRHLSLEVTLPFTPTWLSYEPLSRIDVINGSIKYAGLTSGVTWVLAANRAIVTATLLKRGVVDNTTSVIRRPYRTPRKITATQGQGADITLSANLNGIVQGFDTASGSGTVAIVLTGTSAIVGSDTATATGSVAIILTTDTVSGTDTATATGSVAIVLSDNVVRGSDTATATGTVEITITATVQGTDTATATGTAGGALSVEFVQGSDTATVTGTVSGSLSLEEFTPTDIAGLKLWIDASTQTGYTDGQSITTLTDKTGLRTITVSSGSPTFETNERNGNPIIRMPGAGIFSLNTSLSIPSNTGFLVWAVCRANGNNGYPFLTAFSNQWRINYSNNLLYYDGAFHQSSVLAWTERNNWTIYFFQRTNAGAISLYVNGVNVTSGTPSSTAATQGNQILRSDGLYDWAEMGIYDAQVSDTERNNLGQYLATKWGIPWNLLGLTYTAVAGETYSLSGSVSNIADFSTGTGVIKNSGGTANNFYVHCTLSRSTNINQLRVWTGQTNGAFNQPSGLQVYSGHLTHVEATAATPLSTHTLTTGSTSEQPFNVSYAGVQNITLRFTRSADPISVLDLIFVEA